MNSARSTGSLSLDRRFDPVLATSNPRKTFPLMTLISLIPHR